MSQAKGAKSEDAGSGSRVDLSIVHQYEAMQQEQRAVMNKLAEIDSDRHEHMLVFDALKEMDANRTCHRLIGGVLTQRTVGDVQGKLEEEMRNLDKLMEVLQEHLKNKEKSIETFVTQHREQLGTAVHASRGEKDARQHETNTSSSNGGGASSSKDAAQGTSAGLLV